MNRFLSELRIVRVRADKTCLRINIGKVGTEPQTIRLEHPEK